jgi:DNA-binding NtrC family response regulator
MNEPFGHDTISAPIRSPLGGDPVEPAIVIALCERDGGRRFDLEREPRKWVVGKSPSCDIVIDDPYVSSLHCVLERRADGMLLLRDSESKNGTIVDNNPVLAIELRPGAVIVLGRTYLVAVGDQNPASAVAQLRGHDPRFRAAVELALRAARSDCSVLIVGETGTGKDLVARAVHETSRRASGPFVPINCGAFPRELIGSELFGHARGAFTGAVDARDGVVVHADGGTLFLDELGELSLDLQPHLLRVLETKRVRPIGGSQERAVDVRFVAATNRLDGLGSGASPIRFDLYQRVAAVVVEMPPLRARKADIPELALGFIGELAHRHGARELMPTGLDALLAYDWPGNVRELRQTIMRAVSLTDERIDVDDLGLPLVRELHRGGDLELVRSVAHLSNPARLIPGYDTPPGDLPRHSLVLREMMAHALVRRGSIRAAARELGMPKSTFADKARRFGLLHARDRGDGPEE